MAVLNYLGSNVKNSSTCFFSHFQIFKVLENLWVSDSPLTFSWHPLRINISACIGSYTDKRIGVMKISVHALKNLVLGPKFQPPWTELLRKKCPSNKKCGPLRTTSEGQLPAGSRMVYDEERLLERYRCVPHTQSNDIVYCVCYMRVELYSVHSSDHPYCTSQVTINSNKAGVLHSAWYFMVYVQYLLPLLLRFLTNSLLIKISTLRKTTCSSRLA